MALLLYATPSGFYLQSSLLLSTIVSSLRDFKDRNSRYYILNPPPLELRADAFFCDILRYKERVAS